MFGNTGDFDDSDEDEDEMAPTRHNVFSTMVRQAAEKRAAAAPVVTM